MMPVVLLFLNEKYYCESGRWVLRRKFFILFAAGVEYSDVLGVMGTYVDMHIIMSNGTFGH